MEIKFWLNGKMIKDEIEPDILLLGKIPMLRQRMAVKQMERKC